MVGERTIGCTSVSGDNPSRFPILSLEDQLKSETLLDQSSDRISVIDPTTL